MLAERNGYIIHDDKQRLDHDVVYQFLRTTYWGRGLPRAMFDQAIDGSDCYGVERDGETVGYARVISDQATFAYLCDLFLLPDHRGQGLGAWLCMTLQQLPRYGTVRRWLLATRDAQAFYEKLGWTKPDRPENFMEIYSRAAYEDDKPT
jgi:GNAT superfamily N-acetyltransferase